MHRHCKHAAIAAAMLSTFNSNADDAQLPAVEVKSSREQTNLNLDTPSATGSRLGIVTRDLPASVAPAATQTPPPVATPNSSTLSEHKGV